MAGQNHYPTSNFLTIVPPYGNPEDQPPIDPQSNTGHHQSSSNLPPLPPPSATIASPTSGRHPVYRGIRCRGGKWVSEIREPKKSSRIWLGTYQTPEMAASAYDVAALALKGADAAINFPDWAPYYQLPYSHSTSDIRAAAASAAAARAPPNGGDQIVAMPQTEASSSEFVDEEALFDMPNLLVDMAGGMLVSPPRMTSTAEDEEENYSRNDNLWSYD